MVRLSKSATSNKYPFIKTAVGALIHIQSSRQVMDDHVVFSTAACSNIAQFSCKVYVK